MERIFIKRTGTTRGRNLVRGLFLASFWVMGLPLLFCLTEKEGLSAESGFVEPLCANNSSAVEFGAFATARYIPENNLRPAYVIGFDRMLLSNRSLGLLRTALGKHLQLDNLRLKVFSYSDTLHGDYDGSAFLSDRFREMYASPLIILDRLSDSSLGGTLTVPDISKAARIRVDGFRFDFHQDMQAALSVQSRRAEFAVEKPDELLLLGRVILSTPSGKIECNRAVWNPEKRYFRVQGSYFFSSADNVRSGRDANLDYELNPIHYSNYADMPKGGSLCSANR